MTITIDKSAGFCWGVVKTIDKVEQTLLANSSKSVYVLGEIIHNPHEIKRLSGINLNTSSIEELHNLSPKNSVIMIRAHGEPPKTYSKIKQLGFECVDATCPLVKRLQNKISWYYKHNWQIIIFGKNNHQEVIGLKGFCNDNCVVCLSIEDIAGKINWTKKTVLFSQTTMNATEFHLLAQELDDAFETNGITASQRNNFIKIENTVCKFMINREAKLKQFAKQNDLILFVAGHHSSNGKVLFDICKAENDSTYFIEDLGELSSDKLNWMLTNHKSIGITGATSTPMWFMQNIAKKIENNVQEN